MTVTAIATAALILLGMNSWVESSPPWRFGMISHDLRNPLTPIMGQASLLQRGLAEVGMEREARSAESILKSA